MHRALLFVCVTVFSANPCRGQVVDWVRVLSTENQERRYGVSSDGHGNVFVVGETNGLLGNQHVGNLDIVSAKYSSAGELDWLTQYGSSSIDVGEDVIAIGNGRFVSTGSLRIDRGFVVAYDETEGMEYPFEATWFDYHSGVEELAQFSYGEAIAVDTEGNIYATGRKDFLLSGVSGLSREAFVTKYSPEGAELWAVSIGDKSTEEWEQCSCSTASSTGPTTSQSMIVETS